MRALRTLALATALALSAPAVTHAGLDRELVVCLAPPRAGGAALAPLPAARFAALGLRVVGRLDQGLPAATASLRPDGGTPDRPADPFDLDPSRVMLLEAPDAVVARSALAALAADPAVAWVEPNVLRGPAVESLAPGFPDDPLFRDSRQWGLRNLGPAGTYGGVAGADIHALDAWALSTGANDVVLGVADTGIDPSHPDLAARMPDGSSRILPGFNATAGNDTSVVDFYGHGTPVTGVIAARTNNGAVFDSLGVAGVCGGDGSGNLGCRILPIKLTRGLSGDAGAYDIARAIFYATRMGCRAMNLSWAGDAPSNVERAALHHAMLHGCVVVVAAGNKGYLFGTQPQYPSAYAAQGLCVQVGASDEWDRRVVWSSYGPGLDLVAPGVDIWTTFMTYPSGAGASYPGYVVAAGTSFAAPFVTGTIGLMSALRPSLDASDYQPLLRMSADDVGAPGVDAETGWGRLNAARALQAIGPGTALWHDEVAADALRPLGRDSVRVDGDAPPAALAYRGWHPAERWEASATVAVPDSIAEVIAAWPRVGGTSTLGAGNGPLSFVPWCEVTMHGGRALALRGYLQRIADVADGTGDAGWLPVPPDQARFGFTVLGRLRPAPVAPATAVARLLAAPNPFRAATVLRGAAGAEIAIADVAGRLLRHARLDRAGVFAWDGRDERGRVAPPGLYFARALAAGPAATARIVRLAP